jgi:hypothetical protein
MQPSVRITARHPQLGSGYRVVTCPVMAIRVATRSVVRLNAGTVLWIPPETSAVTQNRPLMVT